MKIVRCKGKSHSKTDSCKDNCGDKKKKEPGERLMPTGFCHSETPLTWLIAM
jgi:hypothetical protein